MSPARLVPIALVLLLPACRHAPAIARAPAVLEPMDVAADADPEPDADDAPVAAQAISFDEDELEPGPSTPIRGAPKRPPIPSFQLFGTRAGDGP